MDERRRKWRISIREALGLVLGLCVGMSLIRAGDAVGGIGVAAAGVAIVIATFGALIGVLIGHGPVKSFAWGLLVAVNGAIIVTWLTTIH